MNTAVTTALSAFCACLGSTGAAPVSAKGLTGRIIRGKKAEDFETLTDDPTRKLVLLMGPDGLELIAGKPGYEMLVAIGYEPTYIEHKVKDGNQFKVIVFNEGATAALATWENVVDIVGGVYPEIAGKLVRQLHGLQHTSFDEIERGSGFDFSEIEKIGSTDNRYMTFERYCGAPDTLQNARAFLYFTIHLREQYKGDGYTYDDKGNRGLMEYITPNCRVDSLGEHQMIDITIELPAKAEVKLSGIPSLKLANRLPLPTWYSRKLIANPYFQPNPTLIQNVAYGMAAAHGVRRASADKKRVFRLHVDEQPDFTWPFTVLDTVGGRVTRYIPKFFKDMYPVPAEWEQGNNRIEWWEDSAVFMEALNTEQSVMGGKLSVPGAWNDTVRSVEWDLCNAAAITTHGFTIDFHPMTARFDMHYWQARPGNPDVKPGGHPYLFMPGSLPGGFPYITPDTCWHPQHNPDGIWQPSTMTKAMIDETWEYVSALKLVVLWTKHCNRFAFGSTLDPIVMAMAMHHNHLRGHLEAEPSWFPKGVSWRTEFFGVFGPEFEIADDPHAQGTVSILQLFDGYPDQGIPPYDLVVVTGQAASHCVLRSMQQAVDHMIASGHAESVKKIVYLMDTASTIPGFEEATAKALADLQALGVQIETTESFQLTA